MGNPERHKLCKMYTTVTLSHKWEILSNNLIRGTKTKKSSDFLLAEFEQS